LQKIESKKFVLKLDSFGNKAPQGIGSPFAPLRRGPDGLLFDVHRTILSVAPVSTKYLSIVSSSVRKIRPAFAGKCMAVASAGFL
jgi:hypothetical protein